MPSKRPNIVITISDDQRYDAMGCMGNPEIKTPAMDALAARGVMFRRTHHGGATCHAVCCPSRAQLFTGRHIFSIPNAIKGWWEEDSARFEAPNPDPVTVPMLGEELRKAGYHCFGTGKWHNFQMTFTRNFNDGGAIYWCGNNSLYNDLKQRPNLIDGEYGGTRPDYMKKGGHFNKPLCEFDGTGEYSEKNTYVEPRHTTEAFSEAAVNFLDAYDEDDKPFFLYVAYTAPHGPTQTYQEWHDMYDPEDITLPDNWQEDHGWDNAGLFVKERLARGEKISEEKCKQRIANHYAITSHEDDGIRRIHEALERNGLMENTIVIHTGDHGKQEGHHGLTGKQTLYDDAVRVPFVMAGPGVPEGQVVEDMVYQHDLFPTLLEACGVHVPEGTYYKSLWPVLEDGEKPHETIFSAYREAQRMAKDDRYKLIEYNIYGERRTQLFDLQEDPGETQNLADDPAHTETLSRLRGELAAWQQRTEDPCRDLYADLQN